MYACMDTYMAAGLIEYSWESRKSVSLDIAMTRLTLNSCAAFDMSDDISHGSCVQHARN